MAVAPDEVLAVTVKPPATPAVVGEGKPLTARLLACAGVGDQSFALSSTDTLLGPALVTARSGKTSPLKSPTATSLGDPPAPKRVAGPNVPLPLPSSTSTPSGAPTPATRSGLPSPLKSPTATSVE